MRDRFGERHGEISIVGTCPTVCNTIAGYQRIVFYTNIGPKNFAVIVIDPVNHIKDNALVLNVCRVCVFVDADPLGSGQLRLYAIIGEHHLIVSGTGYLGVMREAGTVTAIGIRGCTGI